MAVRPGPTQLQQSAGGATGPRVVVLPTIEDLYLPPRYQRRPIDQKEIEYINVSFGRNVGKRGEKFPRSHFEGGNSTF